MAKFKIVSSGWIGTIPNRRFVQDEEYSSFDQDEIDQLRASSSAMEMDFEETEEEKRQAQAEASLSHREKKTSAVEARAALVTSLNEMEWEDLKTLAAEKGVKTKKKDKIIQELLRMADE